MANACSVLMNRSKMINIAGRLTHGLLGLDLLSQADISGARAYIKDFASIKPQEIREAFSFMPSECQETLCAMIEKSQDLIKSELESVGEGAKPSLDIDGDTSCSRRVISMIYTILEI